MLAKRVTLQLFQLSQSFFVNWPFDFKYIVGTGTQSTEEAIFKEMYNILNRSERLRDFFGLDGKNLMNMCGAVRDLISRKSGAVAKKLPDAATVHAWMTGDGNIQWAFLARRVPAPWTPC